MRHLLIIISLLLFTSPLFGDSHNGKNLYGWETSSGIQLREFGDKDIHPQYKGDVENRKPNGLGIMNFPDGSKYVGEWKNGKKHGQGTETESSGRKYVGEWENGEWHGQGNAKFPSGDMYDGLFEDGWLIKGTMYFSDGRKYLGLRDTAISGVSGCTQTKRHQHLFIDPPHDTSQITTLISKILLRILQDPMH